jgi:hypothetical protein
MKRLGVCHEPYRTFLRCIVGVAFVVTAVARSGDARADDTSPPPPPAAPSSYPLPPSQPPPPPPREYYERDYDRPRPPLVISDWPDEEPPPRGYHRSTRLRRGPIIAGSVLFGVAYITTVLAAAGLEDSGDSSYGWLYLPAIGPFIELTNSGTATASTFLVLDGLTQSAGLALLVWGITSPAPVLVRNEIDTLRVTPVPLVFGRGGSGVGLVGTF